MIVDDYHNLAHGEDKNLWEKLLTEPKDDSASVSRASPKVLSKINYIFEKKPLDKLFVRSKP